MAHVIRCRNVLTGNQCIPLLTHAVWWLQLPYMQPEEPALLFKLWLTPTSWQMASRNGGRTLGFYATSHGQPSYCCHTDPCHTHHNLPGCGMERSLNCPNFRSRPVQNGFYMQPLVSNWARFRTTANSRLIILTMITVFGSFECCSRLHYKLSLLHV